MIAFWIAAALLSAAVAILIVSGPRLAARRASRTRTRRLPSTVASSPSSTISRPAGCCPSAERRSARTEAARRLLACGRGRTPAAAGAGRRGRIAGARAAALVLAGGGGLIGSSARRRRPTSPTPAVGHLDPGEAGANDTADQLTAPEMAAVVRATVAKRPADPAPLVYLAHAEVDGDDPARPSSDLKHAIALDPDRGQLWQLLGETITMQAGDDLSPEARAAFERAMALDPKLPAPHYYLGRAKIAAGDISGGVQEWNTLLGLIPADSPAHAALQRQIAAVQTSGALPAEQQQQTTGADQQAMIRAMVSRLAARLKAQPDDPEGWGAVDSLLHRAGRRGGSGGGDEPGAG